MGCHLLPGAAWKTLTFWAINLIIRLYFHSTKCIIEHQLCEDDAHFGFLIRRKVRVFILGVTWVAESGYCCPLSVVPWLTLLICLGLRGSLSVMGEMTVPTRGAAALPRETLPRDSCPVPGSVLGTYPPTLIKSHDSPRTRVPKSHRETGV